MHQSQPEEGSLQAVWWWWWRSVSQWTQLQELFCSSTVQSKTSIFLSSAFSSVCGISVSRYPQYPNMLLNGGNVYPSGQDQFQINYTWLTRSTNSQREAAISNRKALIVGWNDPDLQPCSISSSDPLFKYSECNRCCFLYSRVFMLSAAASSNIYSQIKPLIKVWKTYLV